MGSILNKTVFTTGSALGRNAIPIVGGLDKRVFSTDKPPVQPPPTFSQEKSPHVVSKKSGLPPAPLRTSALQNPSIVSHRPYSTTPSVFGAVQAPIILKGAELDAAIKTLPMFDFKTFGLEYNNGKPLDFPTQKMKVFPFQRPPEGTDNQDLFRAHVRTSLSKIDAMPFSELKSILIPNEEDNNHQPVHEFSHTPPTRHANQLFIGIVLKPPTGLITKLQKKESLVDYMVTAYNRQYLVVSDETTELTRLLKLENPTDTNKREIEIDLETNQVRIPVENIQITDPENTISVSKTQRYFAKLFKLEEYRDACAEVAFSYFSTILGVRDESPKITIKPVITSKDKPNLAVVLRRFYNGEDGRILESSTTNATKEALLSHLFVRFILLADIDAHNPGNILVLEGSRLSNAPFMNIDPEAILPDASHMRRFLDTEWAGDNDDITGTWNWRKKTRTEHGLDPDSFLQIFLESDNPFMMDLRNRHPDLNSEELLKLIGDMEIPRKTIDLVLEKRDELNKLMFSFSLVPPADIVNQNTNIHHVIKALEHARANNIPLNLRNVVSGNLGE
ncbi:hypothetical protein HOH87_06665 [bacterium]|jgi:hypothetical protein|nr:hypothetical protein [bacterium]